MRRFLALAVIAFLMLVVATPVNAGYLIIRILLEGSGGTEAATPGTAPGGPRPGPPGGPGPGRPPTGPGSGGFPTGPGIPPGGPGAMGNTPAPATPAQHDPARCVVVVV